ncbi:MAG: ATP-binding cassette domain-containing protein [Halobacteriales archaeon]
MIEAADLRKVYGDVVAVAGASFRVDSGEIFGLIGPNGAGKTTTLKMLAGLVEPTGGSATVAGFDVSDREMRRRLGYVPEDSPVYEDMTARSYLRFFASLYDVDRETADERIGSTLDRLDLDVRDRPLGNCSKGMRRKVAIARSLVNDPDVLVYDEPASGLDPLTTNAIIDFVRELGADRTVVFSAHNLFHVEALCDRIAIMVDGELVTQGTLDAIRRDHGGVRYRVDTSVPVNGTEPVADGRHRTVVGSMDAVDDLREAARDAGGELLDVRSKEPSLEEIFLAVAGASR